MSKAMDATEVSNVVLIALDKVLSQNNNFTGKVTFDVNCKGGSIISVNAFERKAIKT